jgi:penicillin-binding protein 1A
MPDGKIWEARNSSPSDMDGKIGHLKWVLANSVNQISAWVMKQFNPAGDGRGDAEKLGVASVIDPVPSISWELPTISFLKWWEPTGTIANKGVFTRPFFGYPDRR